MNIKRLLVTLAAIAVLGVYAINAAADGRFIESYYIDEIEKELIVLCSDLTADGTAPDPDHLTGMLGTEPVNIKSKDDSTGTEVPVAYCCLVDISGSMNAEQSAQARAAVSGMIEEMRECDSMSIGTLGNVLELPAFSNNKEELLARIEGLEAGHEDTNLYAGIVTAINTLQSNLKANQRKCIVIITDGMDDNISGYTREEAVRAVSNTRIPIYTIALLRSKQQSEIAKGLGEFARLSVGGRHFAPVIDGTDPGTDGKDIAAALKSQLRLAIDVSNIDTKNKDEVLFSIKYTGNDGSVLSDTVYISAAELPRLSAAADAAGNEEPTEITAADVTEAPENPLSENRNLLIIAGIALLAVIAVIVVIVLKSKKHKPETAEPETEQAAETEEFYGKTTRGEAEFETLGMPDDIPLPSQPYDVRLTAIGNVNINMSFDLSEGQEVVIGRSADIIPDKQDRKLSSKHCSLTRKDGVVYIKDLNSTNGTFKNGVRIFELTPVESDDILTIGQHRFRIYY